MIGLARAQRSRCRRISSIARSTGVRHPARSATHMCWMMLIRNRWGPGLWAAMGVMIRRTGTGSGHSTTAPSVSTVILGIISDPRTTRMPRCIRIGFNRPVGPVTQQKAVQSDIFPGSSRFRSHPTQSRIFPRYIAEKIVWGATRVQPPMENPIPSMN